MLLRLSLLALSATLLHAQPIRTEADTQTFETRLESNPEDLPARIQLMRSYQLTNFASLPADRLRNLRRKHILWMVEHHPDNNILADAAGSIEKSADPEGWAQADTAWRHLVSQPAPGGDVINNAVFFYRVADPHFALELADQDLRSFPNHNLLAGTKGLVLAFVLLGVHNLDQYGRASSFDDALAKGKEAAEARKELEATTNPFLAGGAARALMMQQYALTSHNRPDEAKESAALTERLYQRAAELQPDNSRWKNELASAYQTFAAQKRNPTDKTELLEKALALGNDSLRSYVLPDLATAYFDSGNMKKAAESAQAALELSTRITGSNSGGIIHTGNIILGRIALKQNNIEEAKSRLLAAGRTPGSPVLGSFGPDWKLAQDLLSKGERDTVVAYLDLCRVFWKSGQARLDSWASTLSAGGSPNFLGPPEVNRTQLLGKPAPEFRLKALAGTELSLAEFKGKVVLIDFWATWCAPCRAEMPAFEKLHRELSGKDVVILALDANEPEDTVAEYIKKEKYTFPVLLSEGTDVVAKYAVNAFPTTLALDKTGRVADVVVGNSSDSESRLRGAIDKARAGAPPPLPEPMRPPTTATPSIPPAVSAEDFYRDGYRLRAARDLTGALAAFDRAVSLRKDWLLAVLARANCLYQLKRYDYAIAGVTDAIRLDPKRAASYDERGLSYSYSGRHSEAVPDYTRAIELTPSSAAYNNRGWAYLELGRLDEALTDLDNAIDLGPTNETALGNRSRLNMIRKQYSQVITDCDAALRVNPKSTWAVSRKADAQRMMSGPSSAAAALPAPKPLSPENGAVFDHYSRETTVVWSEVPGAASYMIEWDFKAGQLWAAESHGTSGATITAAKSVATFRFVGAQPGRWRVWAVDAAGTPGPKSEWREFRYTR